MKTRQVGHGAARRNFVPLLTFGALALAVVFPASASEAPKAVQKDRKGEGIEVEVISRPWGKGAEVDGKPVGGKAKVRLSYVTYSADKSIFVGYYQDGWFEMVSLHDAKTKAQLGSISCDGGVPTLFRISKDKKFLGARTGVGWYVWKIPSFEKVFVLGDIDFDRLAEAERDKAAKPE